MSRTWFFQLLLLQFSVLRNVHVEDNNSCSASNNNRGTKSISCSLEYGTHGELECQQERMIGSSGQHADFVNNEEDDTRSTDSNDDVDVNLIVSGADEKGFLSPCQQAYEDSGNNKMVLY